MKPKLKSPGSKRLKLKCDVLLSNFTFKFNLRRYDLKSPFDRATPVIVQPLLRPTVAGRCRLTLSNPS